jgi:putative tricarboxylic transport membrane protein
MDVLSGLMQGFGVALQPLNLLWCFVGVVLGTVIGVMPGLGPPATIAMLLPLTFLMNPASAIIMLAGIYYGAKYGGSTTSILLNVPGRVGIGRHLHRRLRDGEEGPCRRRARHRGDRLVHRGTVGVLGLMLIAPPLARVSLAFSSPEYFALMALGLAMVVLLGGDSMVKALLATLGWPVARRHRHRPLQPDLALHLRTDGAALGIDFVVVAIGVFAIGEVLANMHERGRRAGDRRTQGLAQLLPTMQDMKDSRFAFRQRFGDRFPHRRAARRGFDHRLVHFLRRGEGGVEAPGKVRARRGRRRGRAGRREQLGDRRRAGADADTGHSGFRHHRRAARRAGAVGLQAGAALHFGKPAMFWGLVASMYIGNVMLLILNLPLVPLFAQVLRAPVYVLYPLILGISVVGVYSTSGSLFDVWLLAGFGLLGYLMRKLDFPSAPLILGLVLGGAMERALRQSLMMSDGHLSILVSRPVSAVMLSLALLILLIPLFGKVNAWRLKALK